MSKARSRHVNLPTGFLRVFSLEPQIVIEIKEADFGHFGEVFNLLPPLDELAAAKSLITNRCEMQKVCPTLPQH